MELRLVETHLDAFGERVALTAGGRSIAAATGSGVWLCHGGAGERLAAPGPVGAVGFAPDGLLLAAPYRLDLATGSWEELPPLAASLGGGFELTDAVWDAAGATLLVSCRYRPSQLAPAGPRPATACRVLLLDGASRAVLAVLAEEGGAGERRGLALTEGWAAAGGRDLLLVERASGRATSLDAGGRWAVGPVALDEASGIVAAGRADGAVLVWHLAGAAAPRSIAAHRGAVAGLALHRDGWIVSSGEDGRVVVHDHDGRLTAELALGGSLGGVAIEPDGARAVVARMPPAPGLVEIDLVR